MSVVRNACARLLRTFARERRAFGERVDALDTVPARGVRLTRMERVLVVGSSGSGKSTVARALAARLGAPHVELDALYHGPAWTPRPSFVEDVDALTRGPRWVVDGNYQAVRELLWSRADTVVWLDLPRWLTEWQVVRRSLVRWLRGEVLWNGNREPGPLRWIDPGHPVRWSWSNHAEHRVRYGARFADPAFARLLRVRLTSRAAIRAFVRGAPG